VGLLEGNKKHAWWKESQLLRKDEQMRLAGSLFLARKLLPSPPDPQQASRHASLMRTPASPPPPGFLSFAVSELQGMFPVGWDRRYASHVYSHTPLESSCLEFGQRKGGSRRFAQKLGKDAFEDICLGESQTLPNTFPVRFSVVRTGGKNRGVTVSSGWSQVLAPLHRTLYDHVSSSSWLLRGEAKASRFRRFQAVEGEVFVSGDYESATDGLSCEVAEVILSTILSRCTSVPESVKAYALRSLRADIQYPDGTRVAQARGQLMGNFLSFPLLCLQNYLVFRHLVPRPVPVKINGDDIVFRCRPEEYRQWAENVGSYGLKLCRGKTMVGPTFFSLNSAFFSAGADRVRGIPVLRGSCLVSEGMPGGGAFTKFVKGWSGEARRLAGGLFLRQHKKAICASGRSVVEGLGIPADNSQLFTAGMHAREAFFRCSKPTADMLGDRLEPPLPVLNLGNPVNQDWARVPNRGLPGHLVQLWSQDYAAACGRVAWETTFWLNRQEAKDAWWEEVKRSGAEGAWEGWRRRTPLIARLMGKKRAPLHLPLREPRKPPSKARHVWVPKVIEEFLHRGIWSRRGSLSEARVRDLTGRSQRTGVGW